MNEELTEAGFKMLEQLPPIERAKHAASMMDESRRRMSRLASIRAQALLEMRADGHTYQQIAEALGVTRARVHHLISEAVGKD